MIFGRKQNNVIKPNMAKYIISRRGSYDLDDIADYTIQTFGFAQANDYAQGLKTCFEACFNSKDVAALQMNLHLIYGPSDISLT